MINTTEMINEILTSTAAQRMVDNITPIYGKAYVALHFFNAEGIELDTMVADAEAIRQQAFIQTATFCINLYEQAYGLPNLSSTIEERRQAVKAARTARSPYNPYLLEKHLEAKTGLSVKIIENTAKNTFTVLIMIDAAGEPEGTRDIVNATIKKLKPAHKVCVIEFNTTMECKHTHAVMLEIGDVYNLRQED